jgi:hypothetical protein
MRVVSILTASVLVVGLAACGAGGGGGPGDLTLGPPTSPPVTTTTGPRTSTTARPGGGKEPQVARARFSRLAVYGAPDAPKPSRVLVNPWTPEGAPRERIPQVLLVETQRPDGWVKVLLPDTPNPTEGWVRAFDVKINPVAFRMRIVLTTHGLTVFERGRRIFRGRIALVAPVPSTRPGAFYLRRIVSARFSSNTVNEYSYRLVASLARRVPLGTPVEIVP